MSLAGQTALVTGGSCGIGEGICVELARRGADVIVADLAEYKGEDNDFESTRDLLDNFDQETVCLRTDVTDVDSVRDTVARAVDRFDGLDILVNNAGVAGPTKPCEQVEPDEWDHTLAVNLRGPYLMCREVLPIMKDQGRGRVVNIASISGKQPLTNRVPYTTSKMGLIGLTRTLAVEAGEHDINVNAVCPGAVDGPRMERVIQSEAENSETPATRIREEYEADAARNEMVSREDIANAVAMLCSSDAERITGQDINVDAGTIMY